MATLVQQTSELFADNTSSIAPSITGVTSGNTVVMLVACSQSGTNTALTAPSGWSTAISTTGPTTNTFRQQVAVFYKENAASGSHSGTVTFANNSFAAAVICEFSGLITSSSLDTTNSQNGTATTSASTNTATNSQADSLVLAVLCVSSDAGVVTGLSTPASSGYTNINGELDETAHTAYQFSYKNVSSSASQSGSWTWTNNGQYGAAVVIFKNAEPPPVITVQPVQQTTSSGSTATFSVTATGATSYQWQTLVSGTWTNVSTGTGGTTSSWTTGTLSASDNNTRVSCLITNTGGTVRSAEVYLFISGQPSATKGRRLSSTWLDHKGTVKAFNGSSYLLRSRVNSTRFTDPALKTAFNTWWFDSSVTGITGTINVTVGPATSSISGTTTVTGIVSRTLSNDTSAITGTTTIVGTLARTLANDTMAASGSVGASVTGTIAVTTTNDTSSISGTTTVVGTSSVTLSNATSAISGTTTVTGTLTRTLSNDTSNISGSVGSSVTGTISVTLSNDTLAASGTTTITGVIIRTLANDTSAITGSPVITGSISRTLQNDTMTATGTSGEVVVGAGTKLPMTGVGV